MQWFARRSAGVLAMTLMAFCLSATASMAEDGDPAAGQKVFVKCQVCHSLDAGTNKVGPSLHGLIGRHSASIDGFSYSPAMKSANVTWDPATLDKYLTNPRAMVPGTKMLFPGLPKPEDRANLIAYLKQAAGNAQ
jgi:cytochrome c